MQSTHVSIFPLFVLLGIGLSLLIAVTIVIVSLVKSGKGAGAVVAMVALVLCGLFFAGLFIPVFYARQAATVRFQHEQADMHAHYQELQARQFGGNEDVTVLHLPPAVNITPPPQPAQPPLTAAPQTMEEAFPQAAAPAQAEVTTDLEVETASESSASPEEVPMPTESSQPAEASLEPSPVTRPPAPAPVAAGERPAWLKEVAIPSRDVVFRKTLEIGPHHTLDEIQGELPLQVDQALRDFMNEQLPPNASQIIHLPPGYSVDHGVLADRWLEQHPTDQFSFGEPMHTLHVLVQVDRDTRDDLQARYDAAVVQHRVGAFGLGGGLLLALLGTLYGYLKLDTATKGYYTGRLRLAAGLTGLAAAGTAVAIVGERLVMWV
jgi:hypothetical protein